MSTFREEAKLIPGVARLIAVGLYLAMQALFWFVIFQHKDFASWPWVGQFCFALLVPVPMTIYVLLIGYVYADAKRRGMRHVMWTWLAALIPNAIGIILYFVLREPLLEPCRKCGSLVRHGFAFCPQCGGEMARACPQCRRAVETGWTHCAYCGTSLS